MKEIEEDKRQENRINTLLGDYFNGCRTEYRISPNHCLIGNIYFDIVFPLSILDAETMSDRELVNFIKNKIKNITRAI